MPAQVERFTSEPIVIARLSGHITVEDMENVYADTLELFADDSAPKIYRITDVRQADSNFGEIMKILMAARNAPGSSTDPRIKVIFVGSNSWNKMAREALSRNQFGGVNIPIFAEMKDALDYARHCMVTATEEIYQHS